MVRKFFSIILFFTGGSWTLRVFNRNTSEEIKETISKYGYKIGQIIPVTEAEIVRELIINMSGSSVCSIL